MDIYVYGVPSDQKLADRIRAAVLKLLKLGTDPLRVYLPAPSQPFRIVIPNDKAGADEARVERTVLSVCNVYMRKGKLPWVKNLQQRSG